MYITVKHNMEVAHRLTELPGKCQQIHGHSMQVHLTLFGNTDEHGIMSGLDFGTIKRDFREYIDKEWDHHLHMNALDPWAQTIYFQRGEEPAEQHTLPGLVTHDGDPTVENIAIEIGRTMAANATWGRYVDSVEIWETGTNSVRAVRDEDF